MEPEKADIDRVKDPELRATLLRIKAFIDADTREIELGLGPQTAEIVQLPPWPEAKRGVPNSILRGALFASIQGQHRQYMKGELLAAQQDIEIRFTGRKNLTFQLRVRHRLGDASFAYKPAYAD